MSVKLLFPLIMLTLFGMIHYLGYTRIVKRLHISVKSMHLLRTLLILDYLAVFGYLIARYFQDVPMPLYYLFSLSIGVGFTILIALILYEFLHLLQHTIPFRAERRALFKRTSDIGFLSLGVAYIGSAIAEGSKEPIVEYINVDQERFGGESYRIVQISDMHIGGLIEEAFVHRCVETINALEADLVVITGDLADAPVMRIKEALDGLTGLKSRYGTFYIVGNHEYFHGIDETMTYLKGLGITVLENRSKQIAKFWITGVYDVFGHRFGKYIPDISLATEEIPEDANTLLLAHQPRFLNELGTFAPSLMLSGHTHGGQIWPFGYLVRLTQPYLKGLHSIGDKRHIYVNSGIGFWGPKMRLGSRSEITCIDWS